MDILGSWIQIHMKTDADPKHWPKKGAGADPKKSALASAPPQILNRLRLKPKKPVFRIRVFFLGPV